MRVFQLRRLVGAAPIVMLGLATFLATAASIESAAADSSRSLAPPSETAAVLYALEAALDTHDQDRLVGQFTPEARLTDGALFVGTARIRAWAQAALADETWLTLQDAPEVGPTSGWPLPGDWAVAPVTISRASYRRLAVDPQPATLVAIVQGTQIAFLSVRSNGLWARQYQQARAWQLVAAPGLPTAGVPARGDPESVGLPAGR